MRPSPLVIFHICVGTIGILSGAAALFFVKVPIGLRRSRLRAHDRSGRTPLDANPSART